MYIQNRNCCRLTNQHDHTRAIAAVIQPVIAAPLLSFTIHVDLVHLQNHVIGKADLCCLLSMLEKAHVNLPVSEPAICVAKCHNPCV